MVEPLIQSILEAHGAPPQLKEVHYEICPFCGEDPEDCECEFCEHCKSTEHDSNDCPVYLQEMADARRDDEDYKAVVAAADDASTITEVRKW